MKNGQFRGMGNIWHQLIPTQKKNNKKKQQNTENQTDDQHGAHQTTGLTLGALEG